jgi:phospholipid transport system substrate-binding protein
VEAGPARRGEQTDGAFHDASRETALSLAAAPVLAVAAALPLAAPVAMAQSTRDANAEAFVQQGAREVLAVLNDRSKGDAAKKDAFRALVNRLVDVPKVTRFVLGKYARTATPDQYNRFSGAFRTYAENVYMSRIDDYHGEKVVVIGSLVRKPGDVLVTTQLAGGREQPTNLVWRVLNDGNQWKVVDVQVSGVWLAITQQQDFVSTIDNAGGKIDVLTNQLLARMAARAR